MEERREELTRIKVNNNKVILIAVVQALDMGVKVLEKLKTSSIIQPEVKFEGSFLVAKGKTLKAIEVIMHIRKNDLSDHVDYGIMLLIWIPLDFTELY